MRVILSPPAVPGSALAELKQWLGITTPRDDATLERLIAASLDAAHAFTGLVPLLSGGEAILPARACWQVLPANPVIAIAAIEGMTADAARFTLAPEQWEARLDADARASVRLPDPGTAISMAVRFTAGLSPDWESLPEGLRHGVIRLAAHQHREREGPGAAPLPPASVAALWRPFRQVRLT